MATFHPRTSETVSGVFLVEKRSVETLGEILDDRLKKFRRLRSQDISRLRAKRETELKEEYSHIESAEQRAARVEARLKDFYVPYPLSVDESEVTIKFASGDRLCTSTIRDALDSTKAKGQSITEIVCEIKCGRHQLKLSVEPSYIGHCCKISVTPSELAESQRAFADLREWIHRCRLPRIVSWWKSTSFFAGGALFALIAMFIVSVLFLWKGPDAKTRQARDLSFQAEKILEEGVSAKNRDKAIEILLRMQQHKRPMPTGQSGSGGISAVSWFTWLFVATVLSIVWMFHPPTVVSMDHEGDLKIQRVGRWLKFLATVIPTFLVMGVVSSVIGSAVYAYLVK